MSIEDRKRQNRERFPAWSRIVDTVTVDFGPVRTIWCDENGQRAGKVDG
jgi:hypothetical protein